MPNKLPKASSGTLDSIYKDKFLSKIFILFCLSKNPLNFAFLLLLQPSPPLTMCYRIIRPRHPSIRPMQVLVSSNQRAIRRIPGCSDRRRRSAQATRRRPQRGRRGCSGLSRRMWVMMMIGGGVMGGSADLRWRHALIGSGGRRGCVGLGG
jgi:hypothetical protein